MDDLFLFGRRRAELRAWREAVGEWLWAERALRLKHPRARVRSCRGHLDALGYRLRRGEIEPLGRTVRRMQARARGAVWEPRGPDLRRSFASTVGVVSFGAEAQAPPG